MPSYDLYLVSEPERLSPPRPVDDAAIAILGRLCDAKRTRHAAERGDDVAVLEGVQRNPDILCGVMALCDRFRLDYGFIESGKRLADFGLLAMDMDSTLITIECIDEIADWSGQKEAVAAITAAAMRGEIKDYNESLRQRVALLEGVDEAALQGVYDQRLQLTHGAERLLKAAKAAKLNTLLVSGGFSFFTDRLKQRLGLDETRSNQLELIDGKLTGKVVGEIVNASVKRREVIASCERLGIPTSKAIAIGDGANDLDMMAVAGLSVAHDAKPVVREKVDVSLRFGGLDTLLKMLG